MTKVIVGMSGGVDSSVAAFLLKQEGYQVEGLFMKNWEDHQDSQCSAAQDLADAQAVCEKLNIPLHTVNFSANYWDKVFQYFLDEYHAGRTPNPDILCNKEIKFKAFLDYALAQGADYMATGHYVRKKTDDDGAHLIKAKDREKDQSYFLYAINRKALEKSLFPIGDYTKDVVRKIAEEQGLITHNKKDSTGICFIGERKFKEFLSEYLLYQPGEIQSPQGEILGKHDGLMFYTLGQRQGLNIGGKKNHDEAPWYVVGKDIPNNILIVAQGNNHPMLFSQGLICSQLHWFSDDKPEASFACTAKVRYRQIDQHCMLSPQGDGKYAVLFSDAQRAVTPGQSIVFYQNTVCLGGAIIEERIPIG
jgi:tRNA-specific 2-thiouridylase